MSKNFAIASNCGFQMTFPNGFTASVIWGRGSYSDNHHNSKLEYGEVCESDTAEVAVIGRDGNLVTLYNIFQDGNFDTVIGYLTPSEVVDFLNQVRDYKEDV